MSSPVFVAMDAAGLDALVGSTESRVIIMKDGSSVGPGRFGSYLYFLKSGRIPADQLDPTLGQNFFGLDVRGRDLQFVEPDKIDAVITEDEWVKRLAQAMSSGDFPPDPSVSPSVSSSAPVLGRKPSTTSLATMTTFASIPFQGASSDVATHFGEALREGDLEKYATSAFRGWQGRRFRLYKEALVYFTEKKDVIKMIPMDTITDIRKSGIEIHMRWRNPSGHERTHRLRTPTTEETEAWVEAIRAAWGYSTTE
mmetsp:Transcript_63110/g.133236  ORF Transcript_63110/g.133236 Transcript_63110/m.133236 type:complete len:254 (+) Transcript_63110:17-778(+)